jgi:hypothetical protein
MAKKMTKAKLFSAMKNAEMTYHQSLLITALSKQKTGACWVNPVDGDPHCWETNKGSCDQLDTDMQASGTGYAKFYSKLHCPA